MLPRYLVGPVTVPYAQHQLRQARAAGQCLAFDPLGTTDLVLGPGDTWETVCVRDRVSGRPAAAEVDELLARGWQSLGAPSAADPRLVLDLEAALAARPSSAPLHNTLGLVHAGRPGGDAGTAGLRQAAEHFRSALAADPNHLVARLNLAEVSAALGRREQAVAVAREALGVLEEQAAPDRPSGEPAAPSWLDAGHFPIGFDTFRLEWERAAWVHPGNPHAEAPAKLALLRWRLHALLADLTDDLMHFHEAALARPDLPITRAALGAALARSGTLALGAPHLRRALVANPFDADAARMLFRALGAAADRDGQRRLARDRRLLARAAPEIVVPEPWFSRDPEPGEELASVIVLCCNALTYTRQCLESVLGHTRPPYELVLLDNGSTDDTFAYLEELRCRPGPVRVEVIRNESNVGFPAGCNQALARARGRYLVLLNNDTVVSTGWLEGLIAPTLQDGPDVGLVGPVSNYAPPPQHVATGYAGPDDLGPFAARRRREYAGRYREVARLTGFCLLLRRKVLERVGALDERFGLGFFDDDDLCRRVREAGFRLVLALDVFIHHFGSRTFAALGVDCSRQLRENLERFRAKWGDERTAGHRPVALPRDPSTLPRSPGDERKEAPALPSGDSGVGPVRRVRVSLCAIACNEEKNLPPCLASAHDLVDEMVLVDTGSTDQTKAAAARFGARVFDFPWCDNFAAARNETLHHATGDWIFWLDADDRLDEDARRQLRELFASLGEANVAYVMKVRSAVHGGDDSARLLDQVRLFRNHPEVRWQHRIHEQILPSLRGLGGEARWTDILIDHTGYQDEALRQRKLERNWRLLQLEAAEMPDDPFTLLNLGWTALDRGCTADALPWLRRSLERSVPDSSIVRKLYVLLAQGHRQLGQCAEALAACREGRARCPDDAELLFEEAVLLREERDFSGAEACVLRLLKTQAGEYFAGVDSGLRPYKARHLLAEVYREQGHAAAAAAQWQAVLAEQPHFVPACLGLAEMFLAQGRWDELEQLSQRLHTEARAEMEASVVRARAHLARREFTEARRVLEGTISRFPDALWPRVILSHTLLQEGQDWEAAEAALRGILALAPDDPEARQNLATLLRQVGRPADQA
jgi:GT2 family glycosyltransferase/thioredoxin-like negative regulator of GroEL